ncbi:NAD(P)-dependent oxidoreductase [Flavobacterium columnare NBRC 100251 = ATCC 23463]|uniref:Short-chain dehydrogenase/reductase sdr n=1 Tax=Flavobacterium columnare (strain ATCC 49512 / CIP 103533 / TG 44/87) TaxID=1041826 RepID=G8XBF3_FLACA|nr:SDR family oxidoreductase [Flavobacterium columnare]AEW86733.1 short-chain dehydrogenase/reductase sdr [Flavobacterium columnare ATCC 49512]ANO47146.1 short-chain dehydrogenase/reductase sdr [Flavobacterium columnare]APT22172.1 short-chain dehydrogenase [Flavobacterium columnare]MBF6652433.1 SDR family NAD(P)-dependent oxidoreductase [Flavobacterium columnare]MBF6654890.1 SDR family NAD(P)-dependent oxidoreductase [Flavobacterium columnare]
MKKTVLITGASSGIGLELAKIHAEQGDDLVLVARNGQRLDDLKIELKTKNNIRVYTISEDLSKRGAALNVYNEVKKYGLTIDYLINNAGFGDFGLFVKSNWDKTDQMIQLNITALTQFTHIFLKDMVQRKNGKIMNVASTAAFQPGPLMAVYYATKSYVLHFTEAIANEVEGTGVTITALCPGATESGFQSMADMESSKLVKNKKLPTSREVAYYGYQAMLRGDVVAIHGIKNTLLANTVRFAPRKWVTKITRFIQETA